MPRSRRILDAEGSEFDDVLDGKSPFVSDGGPYVYYFSRLDPPDKGRDQGVLDHAASPGAVAIQVDVATIGAHFSALDGDEPTFIGGCLLLLHVESRQRRAEMLGIRMPSDASVLLLHRAVDAMLEGVRAMVPFRIRTMRASQTQRLLRQIGEMPQHAARILDRQIYTAEDVRATRDARADERALERLVAAYEDTRASCQRDMMYAVFEASFAHEYRGEGDDDDELEIEIRAPKVLLGTIVKYGRNVKVDGTFFTTAYVTSSGSCRTALSFMNTFIGPQNMLLLGHFWPQQTRQDARRTVGAACMAMDTCVRLTGGNPIVYPRVDPIVTYTLRPDDDRWSLVQCARVHAGRTVPSIECTLDGTYIFGHTDVLETDMIRHLCCVFEQSEGDAAWRARGLIAANLTAAAERSSGVVGDSIVFFIARYDVDAHSAHAVCAALMSTRDASGRVVRADILLRGSYDHRPDMLHMLEDPALRGAQGSVRWVVPLEDNERAAWKWQTQRSEGSCTVHAAMVAVKLAQRLIDGDRDVAGAMRERCHVAFAAVSLYALSIPASSQSDIIVQADGSVWIAPLPRALPALEEELRVIARGRTLLVRSRPVGELRAAMLHAGFRREGPFVRKDYAN